MVERADNDEVLLLAGLTTQVATVMMPHGVETVMLLEMVVSEPDGERVIPFAIPAAGVSTIKDAMESWQRDLRKYLIGELEYEPTALQMGGGGGEPC